MPLSAFPKTFGLTELKKGYFPHLFNIPENQEYMGSIPEKHYYMPESMSVSGRKNFEKWYDEQVAKNVEFDFQNELVQYCESDVKLLKQGSLTFKRVFEKEAKFNPWNHITIASACNRDLRQNRMQPNTVASEPLYGWSMNTNQSNVALEWLHWQEHYFQKITGQYNRVRHAANKGECRIPNSCYKADGYDKLTNTIYEFHGCFWHGCPKCFPNRTESYKRLEDRCFENIYQCTQKKMQYLRDKKYNVVEIWECQ